MTKTSAANQRTQRRDGFTQAIASVGGDVDEALEEIGVPTIVVGRDGAIRYQNARSRECFGDLRGRHFTELIDVRSQQAARISFTRKLLGTERASEAERWMKTVHGSRLGEVHAVAIENGDQVVGVFGVMAPRSKPRTRLALQQRRGLTPRQLEVLDRLAEGMSTTQVAMELGIAKETVRNHVRGILRVLGVHTRLEAIVEARRQGILGD